MARARQLKKKMYRKKRYSGKSKGTNKIVNAIQTGNGLTFMNRLTPIHTFKRTDIDFATLVPVPGQTSTGGNLVFRLGNIPGYSEFTNLFQKYRIMKIKLIFNLASTLESQSVQPTLYVCKNLEAQNAAPVDEASMEQQSNVMVMQFSNEHRTFSKSFYPYIGVRTLTNPSAAGDVVEFTDRRKSMWISCADVTTIGTGVIHHGIKYWLNYHASTLAENDFAVKINVEYTLQFKGTD